MRTVEVEHILVLCHPETSAKAKKVNRFQKIGFTVSIQSINQIEVPGKRYISLLVVPEIVDADIL